MDDSDMAKLDALGQALRRNEVQKIKKLRAEQGRHSKSVERADAKVAGGITRPEPVNRAAAMLVSRAPDICHPPTEPRFEQQKEMPKMTTPPKAKMTHKEKHKNMMKHMPKLADALDKINDGTPEDAVYIYQNLEAKLSEATSALGLAMHNLRTELDNLKEASGEALNDIRSRRYALLTETSQALSAMRDLRMFFLGDDYSKEVARLAQFVDLCERLKALKESGFLDAVSDTMLRLATGDTI